MDEAKDDGFLGKAIASFSIINYVDWNAGKMFFFSQMSKIQ